MLLFSRVCVVIFSTLFSICAGQLLGQTDPNALDFDGVNDYVQTTYQGISFSAPRTVEAWIKTTANADPNQGGIQQIITDWGSMGTGTRFTFNVLWNNAIRLEVGGNGVSGTIDVTDGMWHHVAAVYDPGGGEEEIKLYVDGELDVTGNITVGIITSQDIDLRIGRRVDDQRHFDGSIDEVRVWNYIRSQEEIQAEMDTEFCDIPTSLKAYYTFNQGDAGMNNMGETTLYDQSGAGNDGTLTGFTLNGSSSNWVEGAPLELGNTTIDIEEDACDEFTWEANGMTYIESGSYTEEYVSIGGCDSIVTLNLTIHGATESVETVLGCDSYTWEANGETYLESGMYTEILMDQYGCDSTATIDLILGFDEEVFFETEACDSLEWNGEYLTETGIYVDTLENVLGCDSIVVLDLSISSLTSSISDMGNGLLAAGPDNAEYQWLDCINDWAEITGATNQEFQAQEGGSYAVVVSNSLCAADTSECVEVILTELSKIRAFDIRLFPNPSRGYVMIESEFRISDVDFFNCIGKNVLGVPEVNDHVILIDTSLLAPGIYVVKIRVSEILKTELLILE